jgi:hypothetical protein
MGAGGAIYAQGTGGISPTQITFSDLTIGPTADLGIRVSGTVACNGLTFQNNTFSYTGAQGVSVSASAFSNNIVSSGNTFFYCGWRTGQSTGFCSGEYLYIESGSITGNTFAYCGLAGTASGEHGLYLTPNPAGSNINVSGNTAYGCTKGAGLKGCGGPCKIFQNNVYGNQYGIMLSGPLAGTASIYVYDNLVHSNVDIGIVEWVDTNLVMSLYVYNNTVYNNNTDASGAGQIHVDDNLAAVTIENNIIYNSSGGYAINFQAAQTGTVAIDYNLEYSPSAFQWNATPQTLAQWKALGFDTHGVNANPLFANGSGSYSLASDFKLLPGSPAIRAGVNVGIKTDYAGNPVPSVPDIGAYEYLAPLTPPTDLRLSQ